MHTLLILIFNSLFIFGLSTLFDENNLLEGLGKLIEKTIGTFWSKPIFLCPACMASVWGTIGFFTFSNLSFWHWPLYCICLCGLNVILVRVTSNEINITE